MKGCRAGDEDTGGGMQGVGIQGVQGIEGMRMQMVGMGDAGNGDTEDAGDWDVGEFYAADERG